MANPRSMPMRPGLPELAIDDCCPPSIVRDLHRMIGELKAKGATNILIQIPIEDFGTSIDAVLKHVCVPFIPTLCGCACAPWEKDHIGVIHRADAQQMAPHIILATGHEEGI